MAKEGNNNTTYFHIVDNFQQKFNQISHLLWNGQSFKDAEGILISYIPLFIRVFNKSANCSDLLEHLDCKELKNLPPLSLILHLPLLLDVSLYLMTGLIFSHLKINLVLEDLEQNQMHSILL